MCRACQGRFLDRIRGQVAWLEILSGPIVLEGKKNVLDGIILGRGKVRRTHPHRQRGPCARGLATCLLTALHLRRGGRQHRVATGFEALTLARSRCEHLATDGAGTSCGLYNERSR